MSEPYREGLEYVVCTECGSHILLDDPESFFDEDDDVTLSMAVEFRCDSWSCEEEFEASVLNPQAKVTP